MSQQALSEPDADALSPVPGWFGKVVMLGDFAHRRLPHGVISACDQWLSHGISASRVQLGSGWLDTYLTGPVWRFAWAPGVVDDLWWFGVLMPSVDAVGRYFPLVICGSDENAPLSAEAFNGLSIWYAQAGQAALATLEPGASLAGFETALAQMPQWQDAEPATQSDGEQMAKRQRFVLSGTPTLAHWARMLACPLFTQRYARHSFWLPIPAAHGDNKHESLTVVSGLPDPDQFSLMLEGSW